MLVLIHMQSLHPKSFTMYVNALADLASWFHELDHTNYAVHGAP